MNLIDGNLWAKQWNFVQLNAYSNTTGINSSINVRVAVLPTVNLNFVNTKDAGLSVNSSTHLIYLEL